jgi:hypothetical protein
VDLPTPPLPLTTAIIFLTFGRMVFASVLLVVVLAVKFTWTTASLLTRSFTALTQAFLIISFMGQAGVVSTTVKETLLPSTTISLTIFNVTRSFPRSGSCTLLNASSTFSVVILQVFVKSPIYIAKLANTGLNLFYEISNLSLFLAQ